MEKNQPEQPKTWQIADPKPPVVNCGHLEKRRVYEKPRQG